MRKEIERAGDSSSLVVPRVNRMKQRKRKCSTCCNFFVGISCNVHVTRRCFYWTIIRFSPTTDKLLYLLIIIINNNCFRVNLGKFSWSNFCKNCHFNVASLWHKNGVIINVECSIGPTSQFSNSVSSILLIFNLREPVLKIFNLDRFDIIDIQFNELNANNFHPGNLIMMIFNIVSPSNWEFIDHKWMYNFVIVWIYNFMISISTLRFIKNLSPPPPSVCVYPSTVLSCITARFIFMKWSSDRFFFLFSFLLFRFVNSRINWFRCR